LESITPSANFVHRKSKFAFDNFKNENTLSVDNSLMIPTKSFCILNNHEERKLNCLREETENEAINQDSFKNNENDNIFYLSNHITLEPCSCSSLHLNDNSDANSSLNDNITVYKLPDIEDNNTNINPNSTLYSNTEDKLPNSTEITETVSNNSYYTKRDINEECKNLQKTRDDLMHEYVMTIYKYKQLNNQNMLKQSSSTYNDYNHITNNIINNEKYTYNKNIYKNVNNRNNELYTSSSKKQSSANTNNIIKYD